MPRRLKIVSTEVLSENPWWKYKHDVYSISGDRQLDYYYGEKPGVVIAVPVTDDNKIVLVRQCRYLHDKMSVELPMGGIESTETPSEAIKRELQEETGYEASEFVKVGVFEPFSGLFKCPMHVFVASDLKAAASRKPDSDEDFELIVRKVEEVDNLIKSGEIWDGRTLAAWALAREFVSKLVITEEQQ